MFVSRILMLGVFREVSARLRYVVLVISLSLVSAMTQAEPIRQALVFEPNLGQAPSDIKWIGRGPGYQLLFTAQGMTMQVQHPDAAGLRNVSYHAQPRATGSDVVRMKLDGSHPWNTMTGLEPTGGISNYLIGQDQATWHTNIPHYRRIDVGSIYPGIDLIFYSHDGNLEYDFDVAPGANPDAIRIGFDGQKAMHVDPASGDLVLTTTGGAEVRQLLPKVYQQIGQKRIDIPGSYTVLKNGRAGFRLADYDRRTALVIDPLVAFIKTIHGDNQERGRAVATDAAGNAYITGATSSDNFPIVAGFDSSYTHCDPGGPPIPLGFCGATSDAFVMKLAPGGDIIFSTYYGGPNDDVGNAIAVDSTGVWVAGGRGNFGFLLKLTLSGAYVFDGLFGDPQVTANGAEPQTSTLTDVYGIAVDSQHNVWLVGRTDSDRFPQVNTAFTQAVVQGTVDGSGDVFLTKFSGDNIVYSRVIGGTGLDVGYAVAVDRSDDPLITGRACSTAFDLLAQAINPALNRGTGLCNVFVAGFVAQNPDRALFYTTFGGSTNNGGDNNDAGLGIAVDKNFFVYVTGKTYDATFPTTSGAYQAKPASSAVQAFVTRLDGREGSIMASTLLGAEADSIGNAVALLDVGAAWPDVYVAGSTASQNFPGGGPIASNPTTGFLSRFSGDLSFGPLHTLDYTAYLGDTIQGVVVQNPSPITLFTAGHISSGAGDPTKVYVTKLFDDVSRNELLWTNPTTGVTSAWLINSQGLVTGIQTLSSPCSSPTNCPQAWNFIGNSDFNGDGVGDALWYNPSSGQLQIWLMDQSGANVGIQTLSSLCGPTDGCSTTWKPVGIGDFNHDGKADVLWQNVKTGALQAWLLDGAATVSSTLTLSLKTPWQIIGIGDFNHDGIDDLFTYDPSTGKVDIAYLDGAGKVTGTQWLAKVCGPSDGCSATWKPAGMADVDNDTYRDLLWVNVNTGEVQAWLMNGTDRIKGIQSVSEKCGASTNCTLGSVPLGVLTDGHIAP